MSFRSVADAGFIGTVELELVPVLVARFELPVPGLELLLRATRAEGTVV